MKMAVIGCGLIGGSMALSWKRAGIVDEVIAFGHNPATLQKALDKGAADTVTTSMEEAVKEAQKKISAKNQAISAHTGCPGSRIMQIQRTETPETDQSPSTGPQISRLQNWPVQIKLAPVHAPYFNGAKLLIAADCTAYAYAGFHQDFMRNKVTLIGCPKLDQVDYTEKLTAIIQQNDIQSVTILRMEVPCCGGLEMAAKKALQNSGKFIPWQVVTIGIDGKIME